MYPLEHGVSENRLRRSRPPLFNSLATRARGLLGLWFGLVGMAVWAADPQLPVLEFVEPTNHAVFSTSDEIPIVLRAVAPDDVFATAEVFANHQAIATVLYCCPWCPCPPPSVGQETTLRIPAPWNGEPPLPERMWQGWTNVQAGRYLLTAQATGEHGTLVEAAPVSVTLIDRTLRFFVQPDGAVTLSIPQGSMVPGGYDLEVSQDLRTWTRLGPFQPGDVAAFFFDPPPAGAQERRFYRSVYVPAPGL